MGVLLPMASLIANQFLIRPRFCYWGKSGAQIQILMVNLSETPDTPSKSPAGGFRRAGLVIQKGDCWLRSD